MIRIGVCDDSREESSAIRAMLDVCCAGCPGTLFEKVMYTDGMQLYYDVEEGSYFDILLVDIEMPGMDGLTLTGKLKDWLPEVLVIFVSSHEKYMVASFKLQPYRFIPKKRMKELLPEAIKDALKLAVERDGKFYVAQNQKVLEKIPVKAISYIWHSGKYTYIEKSNKTNIKVRKTLKTVFQELPEEDFCWLDKGIIVNLAQVEQVTGDRVVLLNGETLDASKGRLADFKEQVKRFWMDREG